MSYYPEEDSHIKDKVKLLSDLTIMRLKSN